MKSRRAFGGGGVERFDDCVAAALFASFVAAALGEEMLQRAEQVGAEAALRAVRFADAAACEQPGEKLLRELAAVVVVAAFAAEEMEYGIPIRRAQFTERGARFVGIAARRMTSVQRVG